MATFKHYVPTTDRKLKFDEEEPTHTACNRFAKWYFDSSLTDDKAKVTCKKCLKALEKMSELETSEISFYRDSEGVLLVKCKNVTIAELEDAADEFRKQEEIKKQIPPLIVEAVDSLTKSLNENFPSQSKNK